jgi:DNA invertase Pin-like site-specific DNA recombinase
MKIGYARVSTDEQNLDLQLHALAAAGCEEVFQDQGVSGVSRRPAPACWRLWKGQGKAIR